MIADVAQPPRRQRDVNGDEQNIVAGLFGTVDEIAAQLRRTRERWGYSYITVHEPYMRAFASVIERLGGQ